MKPNESELKMVDVSSANGSNEPLSITSLNCATAEIAEKNLSEKPTHQDSKYDPYEHGNQVRPVYRLEANLLLLKYIIGAGLLAIPYSFRNVGYLVGIIGTIFISLLYLHIVHLLVKLEYDLCKQIKVPQLTYVGVVKETFEQSSIKVRHMKPFFVAMIYFNYGFSNILFNAVCLITMAENLHNIFDHEKAITTASMKYYLTLIIIPLTLIGYIPNLKFLVPFSVLTGILTLFNVIIILFIGTNQPLQVIESYAIGDLWQFPSFFAIVLGAFSCTGLILPLKNDMAKPKLLTSRVGVLNVCILLVGVMYAIFGTKAYMKYGDQTQGNILSNLPGDQILSTFVYVSYTVAMGISFTYSFYISFDTLWSNYLGPKLESKKFGCLIKFMLKTLINVLTYGLAVSIPNFELFATLSGSIGILMDIGLPAILQNLLFTNDKLTVTKVIIILKNSIITVMCFIMFVSSLYGSLLEIAKL